MDISIIGASSTIASIAPSSLNPFIIYNQNNLSNVSKYPKLHINQLTITNFGGHAYESNGGIISITGDCELAFNNVKFQHSTAFFGGAIYLRFIL